MKYAAYFAAPPPFLLCRSDAFKDELLEIIEGLQSRIDAAACAIFCNWKLSPASPEYTIR